MNTFAATRKGHKLTLKQLGERVNLSTSFLSDLESGRADASVATLRKIAACYGVNPSIFLDTPDTPTPTRMTVPSFEVCHFVLFSCLRCGVALEIKRYGKQHVSTSEPCPACGTRYIVNWENPTEQSEVFCSYWERCGGEV